MSSTDTVARAKLASLKQSSFQRLLHDAALLHSQGELKRLPLPPGQVHPPMRELRVKTPR